MGIRAWISSILSDIVRTQDDDYQDTVVVDEPLSIFDESPREVIGSVRQLITSQRASTLKFPQMPTEHVKLLLALTPVFVDVDVERHLILIIPVLELMSRMITYKVEKGQWGIPKKWREDPRLLSYIKSRGGNPSVMVRDIADLLIMYVYPFKGYPEAELVINQVAEINAYLVELGLTGSPNSVGATSLLDPFEALQNGQVNQPYGQGQMYRNGQQGQYNQAYAPGF